MNKETQQKVLELELEKLEIQSRTLDRKIARCERANKRVFNAISQEEIDELKTELKTTKLEKEILISKIKEINDD
jgi:hypothetical protein